MSESLLAIGHISRDIALPRDLLGGGVSYSGVTAKELGCEVEVLTRFTADEHFIDPLTTRGIHVFNLSGGNDNITTFKNLYDQTGAREQILTARQGQITLEDLKSHSSMSSLFLVAPVIGEIDMSIIPFLAEKGPVAVTPQGYFREVGAGGTVYQREWIGFEEYLKHATMTILSDEDLTHQGLFNQGLLDRIRSYSPIVVLTRGERGATVYGQNINEISIYAFPLQAGEIRDFTGAGDVFAAAFFTKYSATNDLHGAGVYAAFYSAIKIANSGSGIETVPTLSHIESFASDRQQSVEVFLKENNFKGDILQFGS